MSITFTDEWLAKELTRVAANHGCVTRRLDGRWDIKHARNVETCDLLVRVNGDLFTVPACLANDTTADHGSIRERLAMDVILPTCYPHGL